MSFEDFAKIFKERLEINQELQKEQSLEDLDEWDSLGVVTFIGILKTTFKKTVPFDDIMGCKTVNDLYALTGVGE